MKPIETVGIHPLQRSELLLLGEAPVLGTECGQLARFRVHRGEVHVFLADGDNQPHSFHFLKILEDFHFIRVVLLFRVLVARIERVFILRTWEIDDELP